MRIGAGNRQRSGTSWQTGRQRSAMVAHSREQHPEFDFAGAESSAVSSAEEVPLEIPSLRGPPPTAGDPIANPTNREPAAPKFWTVGSLTRRIRKVLEEWIGAVWVEGEISNLRRQASGHIYFSLKDAEAQLSCVLFKGNQDAGMVPLEDGLHVQTMGDLSVFEPQGKYQLIVREIQPAGQGALQLRYEALKRRLAAEGLFDVARKRPLPAFPSCLALVTSPTGAAVRDLLNVLTRRAPWVRVIIFPVRVQGAGAEAEIAAAVRDLNDAGRMRGLRPDVIVLARGGGSIEDLWAFNDESLARTIVASGIPIVSAVGHEIDFTISDFAADLRAPTPSAAAELVVPDSAAIRRRLGDQAAGLHARVRRALDHSRSLIDLLARGGIAREPRRLLAQHGQRLDGFASELAGSAAGALREAAGALEHRNARLAACRPERILALRAQSLATSAGRMRAGARAQLETIDHRWRRFEALLRSLGPGSILARGFSYTMSDDGQAVTSSAAVRAGQRLTTRFAQGSAVSTVESVD